MPAGRDNIGVVYWLLFLAVILLKFLIPHVPPIASLIAVSIFVVAVLLAITCAFGVNRLAGAIVLATAASGLTWLIWFVYQY